MKNTRPNPVSRELTKARASSRTRLRSAFGVLTRYLEPDVMGEKATYMRNVEKMMKEAKRRHPESLMKYLGCTGEKYFSSLNDSRLSMRS